MKALYVCDFREPPTEGAECYEAIWSQGRSCNGCYRADCYRQGMTKPMVDLDNVHRVQATRSQMSKLRDSDLNVGEIK